MHIENLLKHHNFMLLHTNSKKFIFLVDGQMPSTSDFTKPIKISKFSKMTFKCRKIALLLILLISAETDALSYNGRTGMFTNTTKWYQGKIYNEIQLNVYSFICVFSIRFQVYCKIEISVLCQFKTHHIQVVLLQAAYDNKGL